MVYNHLDEYIYYICKYGIIDINNHFNMAKMALEAPFDKKMRLVERHIVKDNRFEDIKLKFLMTWLKSTSAKDVAKKY